ncbi:MAG: transglutaminase domain-containing protein [Spirochaetales bacterium]|nr:transglutaminase domain-containing protein [Spirochaetales bacterium]
MPYNTSSSLYLNNTKDEFRIESSNPSIINTANAAAGAETNPYNMARLFYYYVIDHATYSDAYNPNWGAASLLTSGLGQCGDYAALFCALCRARGIPARPVVGYNASSGTDETHVWAEFYLEGIGWIPADPTFGQKSPDRRDYYFSNLDSARVILTKGFNLTPNSALPGEIPDMIQVGAYYWYGSGTGTLIFNNTIWNVTAQ